MLCMTWQWMLYKINKLLFFSACTKPSVGDYFVITLNIAYAYRLWCQIGTHTTHTSPVNLLNLGNWCTEIAQIVHNSNCFNNVPIINSGFGSYLRLRMAWENCRKYSTLLTPWIAVNHKCLAPPLPQSWREPWWRQFFAPKWQNDHAVHNELPLFLNGEVHCSTTTG